MIVEVRDLKDSRITTVYEQTSPFDVRITIGNTMYRISERDMKLNVHIDGELTITPIGSNCIAMKGEHGNS